MDKCILKNEDVMELFAWRDRNKALARRCPAPMKNIEIVLQDIDARLKCIREGNALKMHYVFHGEAYNYSFIVLPDGFQVEKQPVKGYGSQRGLIADICGLYSSLMALMTYGDDVEYSAKELDVIDNVVSEKKKLSADKKKKKKAKQNNVIYLFNKEPSGRLKVSHKGKHRSPAGQFNVRGHFRHYQDGKVIWISEFTKGVGKKKNKTYKL